LRVLGGVDFRESFEFFFILSFSLLFSLVCRFLCLSLVLQLFPLLDDLLEIFLVFGLLVVLHGVLDLNFKLCAFLLSMDSSRG
jgi:hypothetical protein